MDQFNTTSWTDFFDDLKCDDINDLNSSALQCAFVEYRQDCFESSGMVDYIHLMYCNIGVYDSKVFPLILCGFLVVVFFTALGVTADEFLCPSLLSISNSLRLSQNVAGVTFLAFGNGAPDIFSAIAGIRQARPEMVIGELYGGGVFVTCIIVGSILMGCDFKLMERPIFRDIIFYTGACFVVWVIAFQKVIYFWEAIGILGIYIVYILIVIIGRIIYQRQSAKTSNVQILVDTSQLEDDCHQNGHVNLAYDPDSISISPSQKSGLSKKDSNNYRSPSPNNLNVEQNKPRGSSFSSNSSNNSHSFRRRNSSIHSKHHFRHHGNNTLYAITHSLNGEECCNDLDCLHEKRTLVLSDSISKVTEDIKPGYGAANLKKNDELNNNPVAGFVKEDKEEEEEIELTPMQELFHQVIPFDGSDFSDASMFGKFFMIWKSPCYFLINMTIPVVDHESRKNNWCRILNSFHVISTSMWVLFVTGYFTFLIKGIPLYAYLLVLSTAASIIVFAMTSFEKPPRFHAVYAFLGFLASICWSYTMATEVVDLLKSIGLMINLSDEILGLTVLAWGNSVGDLVSNYSMSRQGFPRMGISACFGGPMLNLLLGVGLPYAIVLPETASKSLPISYSPLITLLFSTLCASLIFTFVALIFTGFKSHKIHGIVLFVIYLAYLVLAIMMELKMLF